MAINLNTYTRAEDFFVAVRDAAKDISSIETTLAHLKAKEQARAQSYNQRIMIGQNADATHATDVRIDFETMTEQRLEEDRQLLDAACEVIYGSKETGTGGVAALLGAPVANVLWLRYVRACKWVSVSQMSGMSERWCREMVQAAFDTVDAYGIERTILGLGLAM